MQWTMAFMEVLTNTRTQPRRHAPPTAASSAQAASDPRRHAPPAAPSLPFWMTPSTAGSSISQRRSVVVLHVSVPRERAPGSSSTETLVCVPGWLLFL